MFGPYLIAATVGVMLFFSVAVAPTIFKVLPQEWASAYVRKFFPKYHAVLGATCLLAAVLPGSPPVKLLALVCALLFAISLFLVTPAVNRASDSRNRRRFGILHGTSVGINLIQLVLLLYALWLV